MAGRVPPERITMIVGVGIDVLEVERMERELERDGAGFVQQVFCSGETAYCEAKRRPARHYAARFAAKEAVFKALGLEGGDTSAWRDVEIQSCADGSGRVVLHGRLRRLANHRGVRRVWLSMSHTRGLAAAGVILET
jgi:holo-[acyl-carrier protein] synthase